MNNMGEVRYSICDMRMAEIRRDVFVHRCNVKIFKNENEVCNELGKIINHFKHEHKQKQFNNNKQSFLDQFW